MVEITCFKNGSSGNCYLIKNEDTKILLECGIKYNQIVKNLLIYENCYIKDCQACIVTHEHGDHCLDVVKVSEKINV